MPRETCFSLSWLEQTDGNGHAIKSWCKPDSRLTTAGYCTLCCKQVSCANMGIRQILQHATGSKHTELASLRFNKKQGHFQFVQATTDNNGETPINTERAPILREQPKLTPATTAVFSKAH
jgi:hypothetical protein